MLDYDTTITLPRSYPLFRVPAPGSQKLFGWNWRASDLRNDPCDESELVKPVLAAYHARFAARALARGVQPDAIGVKKPVGITYLVPRNGVRLSFTFQSHLS